MHTHVHNRLYSLQVTIQCVILVMECVDRLERLLGIAQQETVVFRKPQSET